MQCKEVIKVNELSKRVKEQEYAEKIRIAYERIEQQETGEGVRNGDGGITNRYGE